MDRVFGNYPPRASTMPDRPLTAMKDGEPSPDTPTTKEALGDVAPQRPVDAPGAIPRGYMASTWHHNTNHLKLLFQNPLKVSSSQTNTGIRILSTSRVCRRFCMTSCTEGLTQRSLGKYLFIALGPNVSNLYLLLEISIA